ncbi:MAG: EamA family transporter RarD [Rhodoglobus sp.]
MPDDSAPRPKSGIGLVFAIASYVLWGFLPLYFLLLAPAGPLEIVAWRIVLSLVFCAFLLTVTRSWTSFAVIARNRRAVVTLAIASVFILINWIVYVFAALSGQVVEAALGYFINPIVTVLLGVFVLRERLRPLQWVGVGISAVAVIVLAVNYGAVPWISLALAASFGLYGLIKKRIGGTVDAVGGLTMETALLAPFAAGLLIVLAATGTLVAGTAGLGHTLAIAVAGVVTAVPLLFFAAAARRIPLTQLGLTQYFAPVLQLVVGVFLLHEDMPAARWIGFGLVWLALVVLTIDSLGGARRLRRAALEPV